jgi:hypothetical protein
MSESYVRINYPSPSTVYYVEYLAKEFKATTNNKGDFIDIYDNGDCVIEFIRWLIINYINDVNKVTKAAGLKVAKCEVID